MTAPEPTSPGEYLADRVGDALAADFASVMAERDLTLIGRKEYDWLIATVASLRVELEVMRRERDAAYARLARRADGASA